MDQFYTSTLIRDLLYQIEGQPLRPDLEETPDRVVRALEEMLDGYNVDIPALFKVSDGEGQDQIVALRDIETWSICQHHLLPFRCRIHVAYLPIDKVIGASKMERLCHAYAHRLQLQERIAKQIAETLMENLKPQGVAVVIHGEHLCMRCRGVKSSTSQLVNSVMFGAFRDESTLRMEVLSLLGLR